MARMSGFPPLNDRRSRSRSRALVVDGSKRSRFDTRSLLEMSGYEVQEVNDGPEAIAMMDQHPFGLDLVVLDYDLPFLNGLETLHALQALRPGLKALLCIAKGKGVGVGPLPEGAAPITKPFTLQELSETLCRIYTVISHYQGPERRHSVRRASPQ